MRTTSLNESVMDKTDASAAFICLSLGHRKTKFLKRRSTLCVKMGVVILSFKWKRGEGEVNRTVGISVGLTGS